MHREIRNSVIWCNAQNRIGRRVSYSEDNKYDTLPELNK